MFHITFDFDESTKSISNLQVTQITSEPISSDVVSSLRIDKTKLILSSELVTNIQAAIGDRIAINYVQGGNPLEIFPVIGKAESFSNENAGNKLTRTNTVSFRGTQNDMLATYGSLFITEPYKNNIYKLIPVSEEKLQELNNQNSKFNLNKFNVQYE